MQSLIALSYETLRYRLDNPGMCTRVHKTNSRSKRISTRVATLRWEDIVELQAETEIEPSIIHNSVIEF